MNSLAAVWTTVSAGDHSSFPTTSSYVIKDVIFLAATTNIFLSTVTDSRQIDLPKPTQEVCAKEQQIQKGCIPTEVKEEPVNLPLKEEQTEPWPRSVETPGPPAYSSITDAFTQIVTVGEHTGNEMVDNLTRVVTVGEHSEYKAPDSLTQAITAGEHNQYNIQPQDDQPLPSLEVSPKYTKKFICNFCHQLFLKKIELKVHLKAHGTKCSINSTNKVFSCLVCGKITNTRGHMTCHMKAHTDEKRYTCSICGNRYKMKCHMKEHIRTHTGERPYTCYICGRSFNRSSTMSKHARIKHREYKPFKCMQCSQCFPLLLMLKQHMKTVHDVIYTV